MNKSLNKHLFWHLALHALFAVLFVMAFILYRERLFADCSYYFFYTVNDQFFRVDHHRFVLAISELIPLLMVYIGVGLKAIAVTYSIIHVLFYYTIFLIVVYRYKDITAGIAVLLLQVVGQLWLYYSPMLEICYGAGLLILFHVMLNSHTANRKLVWLCILELLILTSHPENFIIFFFVAGLHILEKGYQKKLHLWIIAIFFAMMIVKFFTFSDYEGGKINYMMKQNENHLYENLFDANYLLRVAKLLAIYYWELVLFFFITAGVLMREKKWKVLSLFIVTVFGIIALVNVTNYADQFSRYRESLYNPLVVVTALAFLYIVFNNLSNRWQHVTFVSLILVAIARMFWIYEYSKPIKQRLVQMDSLIDHVEGMQGNKFFVNLENCEKPEWQLNWTYPFETMLYSSMSGPQQTVSIATDEDLVNVQSELSLTDTTCMVRRWDVRPVHSLNPKYFRLEKGPYIPLNTLDTTINPEVYQGNITLTVPETVSMKKDAVEYLPVTIKNNSGHKLYSSMKNKNYLFYSWQKTGGSEAMELIPIETDITGSYRQWMNIKTPSGKGDYTLTIGMILNDKPSGIQSFTKVRIK